tara:strand:- start:2393 stop:2698 length:306 start_codon:yes stop_codon:yes gene_type:complete
MVYNVTPNSSAEDQFRRLGFPGKYHSMTTVATTATASFTGSEYGAAAFMIGDSADTATTKIHVAGGGVFNGNELPVETIFDITPVRVQSHGGKIFVFKRQQ